MKRSHSPPALIHIVYISVSDFSPLAPSESHIELRLKISVHLCVLVHFQICPAGEEVPIQFYDNISFSL